MKNIKSIILFLFVSVVAILIFSCEKEEIHTINIDDTSVRLYMTFNEGNEGFKDFIVFTPSMETATAIAKSMDQFIGILTVSENNNLSVNMIRTNFDKSTKQGDFYLDASSNNYIIAKDIIIPKMHEEHLGSSNLVLKQGTYNFDNNKDDPYYLNVQFEISQ